MKQFLKDMIDKKASDVFIIAGLPLTYRYNGTLVRTDEEALKPAETKELVADIYALAGRDERNFHDRQTGDDDFSFSVPGVGRFRANVFRQRGSESAVIRVIPFGLPDPVEFRIPEEVLRCAQFQKGLVLVTGPSGAGKSATLACIIDKMNHERTAHIITMESPIEYVHHHRSCIVTQREIPTDISTYSEALQSALREAPDVMFLGEMRDFETISTALTAAETTQLVFSTLHTTSASSAVDRIIDAFPATQQRQVRLQLASSLQAIIAQQLVPGTDGYVVPAFEIMYATPAIKNLIREEKTHQIDSEIAAGGKVGMRVMDQSLFDLTRDGVISKETALQYCARFRSLQKRFAAEGI